MTRIIVILLLCAMVLSAGCLSDVHLDGYPEVSFSGSVQPLISGNCTQAGCHGDVNTSEFRLLTYDDIRSKVNPGNGRKSDLYRAITGRWSDFMPPSPSAPLNEDQIRTIFVWIEQGAKNN